MSFLILFIYFRLHRQKCLGRDFGLATGLKVNLPRNYQGLKRLVKIQISNFELSGQTEIDVHTDRDRNI